MPDAVPETILPPMLVQNVAPNPAATPFLRVEKTRGARRNTGVDMPIDRAAIDSKLRTG